MQEDLMTMIGVVVLQDKTDDYVLVKSYLIDEMYSISGAVYEQGEFVELILIDRQVLSHGKYDSHIQSSGTIKEIHNTWIDVAVQNEVFLIPKNLFDDQHQLQVNSEVILYSNSDREFFYGKVNKTPIVQPINVHKQALLETWKCLRNLFQSKKINAEDLSPEVWDSFSCLIEDPDLHDQISSIYGILAERENSSPETTLTCGHQIRTDALVAHVSDSTNGYFVLTPKEKEIFYIGCVQCSHPIEDQVIQRILEDRYREAFENMKVREKSEAKMYDCQICYSEFRMEEMITLECNHYFCGDCCSNHISAKIQDSQVDINCPLCNQEIEGPIIEFLISSRLWDYYVLLRIKKHINITECPECHLQFEVEGRNVNCECGKSFCNICLRNTHSGTCDQEQIRSIISQLEGGGVLFAQCPSCKMHFTKDENCEHVKCTQCSTEFCFQCSCLRSPTIAHGAHFHRPQCKFFADYGGNDQFSRECSECAKNNRLCSRPVNLQVPRKFNEGEV